MDSMNSLMDLLILGCGGYLLYCYYLMKTQGVIKEGVLLSKNTPLKKCKDKEGYIREASPKLLIYSISVILCGALGMLESYTGLLGTWYLLIIVFFLAVTVWFAVQARNLMQKYWPH